MAMGLIRQPMRGRIEKRYPFMYYHSTDVDLPNGELLIPTPSGFAGERSVKELEALFESVRPQGEIPRSDASFLCRSLDDLDGAGGREGIVYAVEPLGDVGWSDLAWYSEAQLALEEGDHQSARAYAEAYWSGEPFPVVDQRLPEGRCRALKVLDRVEEPDSDVVIRPGVRILESLRSFLPVPDHVVEGLIATSENELISRGKGSESATENPDLPDGSVALWGYGEVRDFSVMSLETLSGAQLALTVSTEAEERIRQHPSYAEYRERTLAGSVPPPIQACQTADGKIRSANRRRLLVAQETGVPLRAWLERLNHDTTVVSYGQFRDALQTTLERLSDHPERAPTPSPKLGMEIEPKL